MIRGVAKIAGILVLGFAVAPALRADEIVLRSSARAASPVTLREIATLEGPDAEALGAVIVLDSSSDSKAWKAELSVEDIRTALNSARPGIRWGKIALSGDSCSIRLIAESTDAPATELAPAPAAAPASIAPVGPTWHVVADMREESLRTAIATRLVSFLKASPSDVRVAFADSDATLLDTVSLGRTLDIQPTGLGAMVPVMVRVFDGERVVAAGTAKVRVEQKLQVVGATRSLHRGDVVTKEVVITESRWTIPGQRLASEATVLGSMVKNRLQPGELFLESDVEPAILVKRGDIVDVACLAGSIVMNTKARAMANGRENEMIEFTPLRNTKTRVTARVVAPGQAVVNADGGDDQVYQSTPVAAPTTVDGSTASARVLGPGPPAVVPAPRAPELATTGTATVQRVTTKPDGTFVVEAATKDPKKPVRKMKFMPIDVPQ